MSKFKARSTVECPVCETVVPRTSNNQLYCGRRCGWLAGNIRRALRHPILQKRFVAATGRHRNSYPKRKCKFCGEIYQPCASNQKFCRPACRDAARGSRHRCVRCGGGYERVNNNQKYCPACKVIMKRVRNRAHSRAERLRRSRQKPVMNGDRRKVRTCLQCGEKFLSEGPWHRCCGREGCETRLAGGGRRHGRNMSGGELIDAVMEIEYHAAE